MPPRAKLCYICGRPYLLPSYDIHVAQCKEIFEKRESLKPVKERRRCPEDPSGNLSSNGVHSRNSRNRNDFNLDTSNNKDTISINKSVDTDLSSKSSKSKSRRNLFEDQQINAVAGAYGLNECPHCNRKFNDVSFSKHVKICVKVFQNKRKPFDSAKARAKNTELMQYITKSNNKTYNSNFNRTKSSILSTSKPISSITHSQTSQKKTSFSSSQNDQINDNKFIKTPFVSHQTNLSQSNMPKWKADSLAFRQAMKEAKKVSLAQEKSKATGIPLHLLLPNEKSNDRNYATSSIPSGYITCPTCNRSFNEQAGNRHIPQCKSIINKPKVLYRGSGVPSYSTNSPEMIKQNQKLSYQSSTNNTSISNNRMNGGTGLNSRNNNTLNLTSNINSTDYNIITGGLLNQNKSSKSNSYITSNRLRK